MNEALKAGSPDRFGYEWSFYSTILPESREQLKRWLGNTGLSSFRGRRVLDVGCGMGRNPYWMLQEGAASLVAIDADPQSVQAAKHNLHSFTNAQVALKSVYELSPSDFGLFDRVTCIGVLHHLQDPPQALQKMWSVLKPGGELVLWCYGKEGNRLFLPFIQFFRALGSRLPIQLTHWLARVITAFLYPFLKITRFKTSYFQEVKQLSYQNIESIVFDQILPKIAHYWSRSDLEQLFQHLPTPKQVNLEFVQGNSWHIRLTKSSPELH